MQAVERRGIGERFLSGLLDLFERHFVVYLLAMGGLLIAGLITLPGLMVSKPSEGIPAMIGFVVCFAALIGLPFAAMDMRSVDQSIEHGETLAEWHYTDEDRRRFVGISLAPQGAIVPPGTWIMVLVVTVGTLVLAAAADLLIAGVTLSAGMLLLAGVVSLPMYAKQRRNRTLRAANLRAARITPEGLKVDGEYLAVNSSGLVLRNVALLAGTPALLTFTSHHYRLQKIGYNWRSVATGGKQVLRLPVPAGREEEAATLVAQLKEELPDQHLVGE